MNDLEGQGQDTPEAVLPSPDETSDTRVADTATETTPASTETTGGPDTDTGSSAEAQLDAELDALRKQASLGQRKITELGMERSDLQRELDARDQRLAQLERQIAINNQPRYTANTDDTYSDDSRDYSAVPQDYNLYRQATQEAAVEIQNLKNELNSIKSGSQRDNSVRSLVREFGISEENARTALDFQDQGDIVQANRVILLARQRADVRESARRKQDAKQTVPTGGNASGLNQSNRPTAAEIRERLDNMTPEGRKTLGDLALDDAALDEMFKDFNQVR